MKHLFSLFLCLVFPAVVCAQQIDTIRPASGAAPLRTLWQLGGNGVGLAAGVLGDVYQTGRTAWIVSVGNGRWRSYVWDTANHRAVAKDTVIGASFGRTAAVGHFMAEHEAMVVSIRGNSYFNIIPTDSHRLQEAEGTLLHCNYKSGLEMSDPIDAAAADLDGDSLDDLVLLWPARVEGTVNHQYPEIWIYRGGASFPRSDTPDVVIVDRGMKWRDGMAGRLVVADVDGDQQLDIVTMGNYEPADSSRCTIFHLQPAQPLDTSTIVQYVCATSTGFYLRDAAFQDLNGDKLPDLAIYHLDEPYKVYLYTSSPGRTLDKRVLTGTNADAVWGVSDFSILTGVGPLNDTTGRWQMFNINGLAFSGGTPTSDAFYDATSGAFGTRSYSLKDADGDGWSDVLTASANYAAVIAGGPEIPRDVSSGVEWLAVTGRHERSVAVWPNPAREVLHIAWRGDLGMRRWQLEVRTMSGELVAQGEVDARAGAAKWGCSHLPAGSYVLLLRSETLTQPLSTIVHIVP